MPTVGLVGCMELRKLLKSRREALNLTQADVADRLSERGHETSPARVGHWETGRNRLPIEDAEFRVVLAAVLQMELNEMMVQLGFVMVNVNQSPEARLAADIVDKLPALGRELALNYLHELEKQFASDNQN
jgi:transcriptional regulator with XRE-family HTH domain